MTEPTTDVVPLWTLATRPTSLPEFATDGMTASRVAELRSALTMLSDAPLVTLEAHPSSVVPEHRTGGVDLAAASPLAMHLADLVKNTSKSASSVAASGETLYRMVVPAKVAAQVGGVVTSMPSTSVANGVHSAMVGGGRIVGQASFVPVTGATVAKAGTAVAGASLITVAAPLVLMAVAVGASAHAESQRREALERITTLLTKLNSSILDAERHSLEGCRPAIRKATAVVLDKGTLNPTLGLAPAVYAIDTAVAAARDRLKRWQQALDGVGDKVELDDLNRRIDGVTDTSGEFYAHLELARLAITLRRQVILLQAVSHAQADPDNPFERFVRELKADQEDVDALAADLTAFLMRLSSLQLDRSHGVRDFVFGSSEVDRLLDAIALLQGLGKLSLPEARPADIEIDITRHLDGSVTVYPALEAVTA